MSKEKYTGQIKAMEIDIINAKKLVQKAQWDIEHSIQIILDYQKKVGFLETEIFNSKTNK